MGSEVLADLVKEFNSLPLPALSQGGTRTLECTDTCLCVHAVASTDLCMPCPTALAISWEGVDGAAVWTPEAQAVDPMTPALSHAAIYLPISPFLPTPLRPGTDTAANLLPP